MFLASDRSAQITGIVLPVDGGTTAGPPGLASSSCCWPDDPSSRGLNRPNGLVRLPAHHAEKQTSHIFNSPIRRSRKRRSLPFVRVAPAKHCQR